MGGGNRARGGTMDWGREEVVQEHGDSRVTPLGQVGN